ncbi:MAG: beta-ketoacyl synthase N-terminal-like domain-containing protein, partial [Isosphaeraceae bacterium]
MRRGGVSAPRVVVTGLGLVTGLGPDAETTWRSIRNGGSGLVWIDELGGIGSPARVLSSVGEGIHPGGMPSSSWACDGPTSLAAPVLNRRPGAVEHAREGEGMPPDSACESALLDPSEPCSGILQNAAVEALRSARFDRSSWRGSDRVAILIGQSKGRVRTLTRAFRSNTEDDPGAARDWRRGWPDSGSSQVRDLLSTCGPLLSPVAACATGLVAVLQGANLIRWGEADVAIAGAVDASLEPLLLAAFRNMKVLARHEEPARAVRPWDCRRNGFAVGEGGAVFVLERADRAEARGIPPVAEVAGGSLGSDAYHITDQNPDPSHLAGLIRQALDRAGVDRSEIDHVNVHGTATRSNDPLECRALRMALGPRADRVSCSANKAQI